jgi:hypothetical protein
MKLWKEDKERKKEGRKEAYKEGTEGKEKIVRQKERMNTGDRKKE